MLKEYSPDYFAHILRSEKWFILKQKAEEFDDYAIRSLTELLDHKESAVRFRAMLLLLEIGEVSVAEALRNAMETDEQISDYLQSRLNNMTGQRAWREYEKEWWRELLFRYRRWTGNSYKVPNYSICLRLQYNGGWGWEDDDWDIETA